MCGEWKQMSHGIGWYCGPVHHDPGERFTLPKGEEVEAGGMTVCKSCHDRFYGLAA